MHRIAGVLGTLVLVTGVALAQPAGSPTYVQGENPLQGDFDFAVGRPINVFVDVQGLTLDTILVTALDELKAGAPVHCEVQFLGTNSGQKKATLAPVLLLEDSSGKGVGRITCNIFKAKPGRPYDERQKVQISGDALASASKVYVLVQIEF
ncbi:MAG: hypothetical protein GW878_03875 [Acidobacteria bacterium]|nr:hypothetical protein [Acidobacteriota bacterium]